jgi:hypothetical protein
LIALGTLTVTDATLQANGGNGGGGSAYRPAGGGSGGGILLAAKKLVLAGNWSVQAKGGKGQAGSAGNGGGGGGGRVAFYSGNTFGVMPANVATSGGASGGGSSEAGSVGTFRYNGDGGAGDLSFPFGRRGTVILIN